MKRSLSQYITGERIPAPDAEPDLYNILTLAAGPWSEARFEVSPPMVVKARHWLTFAESLSETATLDVDTAAEHISDESKLQRAKTPAARESLVQSQIKRASRRLSEARKTRQQARDALLLDEDD